LDGIVEAYAGERGFMGTHHIRFSGFLKLLVRLAERKRMELLGLLMVRDLGKKYTANSLHR